MLEPETPERQDSDVSTDATATVSDDDLPPGWHILMDADIFDIIKYNNMKVRQSLLVQHTLIY